MTHSGPHLWHDDKPSSTFARHPLSSEPPDDINGIKQHDIAEDKEAGWETKEGRCIPDKLGQWKLLHKADE